MAKRIFFTPKGLEGQITQFVVGDSMTVGDAVAPTEPGTYLVSLADSPVDEITISPSVLVLTQPSIAPASGSIGTVFTITRATFSGSPVITGILTQNGVNVTGSMVGDTFTATANGPLVWVETATALGVTSETEPVSATIAALPASLVLPVPDQTFRVGTAITPLDLAPYFAPASLTFSVTGGPLPAGLSMTSAGVISGTPSANTDANITISVTSGTGAAVTDTFRILTASVPSAMAAPVLTAIGSSQISVDRAAAPAANGAPILGYDVQYRPTSGGAWVEQNDITDPVTIFSLLSDTPYEAQTAAYNAIGRGPWSPSGTATTGVAGAEIGQTSLDGEYFELNDLPAGFISANVTSVNPALVSITQTVASVSDVGVTNTRTLPVEAHHTAEIVDGKLRIGISGNLSNYATAINVTIQAGALTNGAATNALIAGAIAPRVSYRVVAPTVRLAGVVTGKTSLFTEHEVVGAPFWVEAEGFCADGAVVQFTVTDGSITQTRYSLSQSPSRYCDFVYLGYAARDNSDAAWLTHAELRTSADFQWNKNTGASGNAALGGLGVFSHTTAFNNTDFADGALTVTVTMYSFAGGVQNATSESWVIYNNRGGYTFRDVYVSLSGNDTTGAGTAGNPYATIAKGVLEAASPAKGCLPKHMPRVFLIGSGNPNAPAVHQLVSMTFPGPDLPNNTDTYVTILPAPGSTDRDTKIIQPSGKATLRTRRTEFRNLHIYVDGVNGFDSLSFTDPSTSTYPTATNPQTLLIRGCTFSHSLGRDGHVFASNDYAVGDGWARGLVVHFLDHVTRDVFRKGHVVLSQGMTRNLAIMRVSGDAMVGPKGLMFGIVVYDNAQSPNSLAMNNVTGTINVGDIVTGTYSSGVATVAQYYAVVAGGQTRHRVVLSGLTGGFKQDDNRRHHAVPVADASAFVVGSPVRVGAGTLDRMLLRKDGNILRVAQNGNESSMSTSGAIISQPATGASSASTANSALSYGIFFSGGANANYAAVHPDMIQIPAFLDHRIIVTPVSGTLAVGQQIRKDGSTAQVLAVETLPGYGLAITVGGTGSVTWGESDEGDTFATLTGETFVFNYVYDLSVIADPRNFVMANVYMWGEGASFFAENGSTDMTIKNSKYVSFNGTRENSTQWGRIQRLSMVGVSAPQRPLADRLRPGIRPRGGVTLWGVVAQSLAGTYAGQNRKFCHAAAAGETSNTAGITEGPYTLVTNFGPDDDAPAFGNFGPIAILPQIRRASYGPMLGYDMWGNPRPGSGAAIGPAEAWIVNAPAVSVPGVMAAPTVVALSGTSLRVTLAADPPDGGSPITRRDVRFRTSPSGPFTEILGVTSPHDITGLTAGAYDVSSRAVNVVNSAPNNWSLVTTVSTALPPSLVASESVLGNTVTMPAGQVAGQLLVLKAGRADTGGLAAPAGYTLVPGSSRTIVGNGSVAMFQRIATANGETVPTVTGAAWCGISVWANAAGVGSVATADVAGGAAPTFGALTVTGGANPGAEAFLFCRAGGTSSAIAPPSGYTLLPGAGNANARRAFYATGLSSIPATASTTTINAATTGATVHAEIMAAT